jgi:anthranilate synthase component 1
LAQQSDLIPVCLDLMADLETPVSVYARLRALGSPFLFESVTGGDKLGRYSFCGAAPALTLTAWEDRTEIVRRDGTKETLPTPADPLCLVKKELSGLRVAKVPGLPPFVGGMVGMVGYEYVHRIEPTVPKPAKDPAGTPLLHFMLVDRVVAFDNARQTLRLIVNARVKSPADADAAWAAAKQELEALRAVVTGPRAAVAAELPAAAELATGQANFSQERFEAAIRRTRNTSAPATACRSCSRAAPTSPSRAIHSTYTACSVT